MDKEIKDLIRKIENNSDYQLRNSEFYEPWDMSKQSFENIADSCYYLLGDCLTLLKKLCG